MFLVEIGLLWQADEKLAFVGAGTGVGHAESAGNVFKFRVKLVLESLAKHTLSTRPSASRITSLKAKVFHKPMKIGAIVIPLFDKLNEVLTGLWDWIRVYHDVPIA